MARGSHNLDIFMAVLWKLILSNKTPLSFSFILFPSSNSQNWDLYVNCSQSMLIRFHFLFLKETDTTRSCPNQHSFAPPSLAFQRLNYTLGKEFTHGMHLKLEGRGVRCFHIRHNFLCRSNASFPWNSKCSTSNWETNQNTIRFLNYTQHSTKYPQGLP